MKRLTAIVDDSGNGVYNVRHVDKIANILAEQPDTIEELTEAMKLLDPRNEGFIPIPELRWAMTQLGDPMEDTLVDEMIKELEHETQKGYVSIFDFASACFAIKKGK